MADLNLSPFLASVAYSKQPSFTLHELRTDLEYSEQQVSQLRELGLLVESQPLEEVHCLSCDGTHPVYYHAENSPYTVCSVSGAGPELVSFDRIRTLSFRPVRLLELLRDSLKLEGEIKERQPGKLWLLGTIDLRGIRHMCYFAADFASVQILPLPTLDNSGQIVFVPPTEEPASSSEIVTVPFPEILHSEEPFFDYDELVANLGPLLGLLSFNQRSGLLSLGNTPVARFEPQSPSHLFMVELWKADGEVVSHRDIIKGIEKKRDTDYEDPDAGSRNIKRRLNEACPSEDAKRLFNKLIRSGRNANGLPGYRLIRTLPQA